jgi:diacylglycerol kinase (ATP)
MLRPVHHVIRAAGHSWAGLKHLLASELSARIEAICGGAAFVALILLGRQLHEIVTSVILFSMLMGVEALNTAIERIVDHLSPEKSEFARVSKDLGSTAVMFLLLANVLYLLFLVADSVGLWRLRS